MPLCFPVLGLQDSLGMGNLQIRLPGSPVTPELLCSTACEVRGAVAPGRTLVTLGLSGLCSCQGSSAGSGTAQRGRMLGEKGLGTVSVPLDTMVTCPIPKPGRHRLRGCPGCEGGSHHVHRGTDLLSSGTGCPFLGLLWIWGQRGCSEHPCVGPCAVLGRSWAPEHQGRLALCPGCRQELHLASQPPLLFSRSCFQPRVL